MKKVFYVVLLLSIIAIFGFTSLALSASVPDLVDRKAQITNAPKNANAIIGGAGIISAIRGNTITIYSETDRKREITIQVNNASQFKVGEHVVISNNVLSARASAAQRAIGAVAPSNRGSAAVASSRVGSPVGQMGMAGPGGLSTGPASVPSSGSSALASSRLGSPGGQRAMDGIGNVSGGMRQPSIGTGSQSPGPVGQGATGSIGAGASVGKIGGSGLATGVDRSPSSSGSKETGSINQQSSGGGKETQSNQQSGGKDTESINQQSGSQTDQTNTDKSTNDSSSIDKGGDKPDPGSRPDPEGRGGRTAKITQASRNFSAIIGDTGRITAIRGNQITMHALNDKKRIATITVNNASMFMVGQSVNVRGNQLTVQGRPGSREVNPAQTPGPMPTPMRQQVR